MRFTGATHQQGDPLPEGLVFPLDSLDAVDVVEQVLEDIDKKQLVVSTQTL